MFIILTKTIKFVKMYIIQCNEKSLIFFIKLNQAITEIITTYYNVLVLFEIKLGSNSIF